MKFDLDTILTLLPYAGILLTWIFKDRILNALNFQLKKNEVNISTSENISQNLKLYQEMLDDYAMRASKNADALEARILILETEKTVKESLIAELNKKLDSITKMLKKSTRQVEYYSKHSEVKLPKELE